MSDDMGSITPNMLEKLINDTDLDEAGWIEFSEYGFRQYFLWRNVTTGASIALLDYEAGGTVPTEHTHASNQFMYCLEGDYEYVNSGLRLLPGSFYMNPKGHPHGPTIAHSHTRLIEIYDGPHYDEKPEYHTDETIGGSLSSSIDPS